MSPAGRRIRAVTFDFWGTLYAMATGNELERRRRRAEVVIAAAGELAPGGPPGVDWVLRLIRDCVEMRTGDGRGLRAGERLAWLLGELGVALAPQELEALTREVVALGLEVPPRPLPRAREVVREVGGRYEVGLVSDTGLTEGRLLRELLRSDGLAPPITAFGMSDETGWMKPAPGAFLPALEALGAAPGEAVHVGDLAATDVAGALALGMRAIWIDTGGAGTGPALADLPPEATARLRIVRALAEVPAALEGFGKDA